MNFPYYALRGEGGPTLTKMVTLPAENQNTACTEIDLTTACPVVLHPQERSPYAAMPSVSSAHTREDNETAMAVAATSTTATIAHSHHQPAPIRRVNINSHHQQPEFPVVLGLCAESDAESDADADAEEGPCAQMPPVQYDSSGGNHDDEGSYWNLEPEEDPVEVPRAFAPNFPAAMQCLLLPSRPSGLERIDLEPPRVALTQAEREPSPGKRQTPASPQTPQKLLAGFDSGCESIGSDNSQELRASTPPPANKQRPIARKSLKAKHQRPHHHRQHQEQRKRKCTPETTRIPDGDSITFASSTEQVRSSQDRHDDLWDLERDVALLPSVQLHGAPEHGSLTNAHPLIATAASSTVLEPTLCPLVLRTFQTRSRETAQRLQEEAVKANRRYIPPARVVHQHITCPITPPATPASLERLDRYAVVRIGDTIECRFMPKTPFEQICRGTEIPARNQVALAFETRYAEGPDKVEVVRQLEFEVFYYSFDDGLVCLRCQHNPAACSCGYASDLLEINRDWKLKCDPTRRLGLRRAKDGSAIVALRIPRSRRPLTEVEVSAGLEARNNNWNAKLRLKSQKDPKSVVLQVTEYSRMVRPGGKLGPRTMLSRSQGFARLIAKNDGQSRHSKRQWKETLDNGKKQPQLARKRKNAAAAKKAAPANRPKTEPVAAAAATTTTTTTAIEPMSENKATKKLDRAPTVAEVRPAQHRSPLSPLAPLLSSNTPTHSTLGSQQRVSAMVAWMERLRL